tara:strand:+ start:317 stop:439 length:123 start_codon:yes stop_codon:yes gene_type:complete
MIREKGLLLQVKNAFFSSLAALVAAILYPGEYSAEYSAEY